MKLLTRYRWTIAGVGLLLLAAAFLLFRPDKLFVDNVVDETLDDAFANATQAPPSPSSPATAIRPASPVGGEVAGVTTPLPIAAPPSTTTVPEPTIPAVVSSGAFYGIDHAAVGTATVYEQDGTFALRFEDDTDIQNGPDLYVWVLPAPDYDVTALSRRLELGKIKGNVGGQNYELPPDFDPALYRSVLIWCERFDVPFAAVPLDSNSDPVQ